MKGPKQCYFSMSGISIGSLKIYFSNFKAVYGVAPFPHPQLSEFREKYTYNITPFTAAMSVGKKPTRSASGIFSDLEDDLEEDDLVDAVTCFTGILPMASGIMSLKGRQIS